MEKKNSRIKIECEKGRTKFSEKKLKKVIEGMKIIDKGMEIIEAFRNGQFDHARNEINKFTPMEALYFGTILENFMDENEIVFFRIWLSDEVK